MSLHHVEDYTDDAGETRWRITVGDDVVAVSPDGYTDRRNALHSLFGIWFGNWDESFLSLYQEWQAFAGEAYEVPPEAQEGAPVHIPQTSSHTGEYADDPITAAREDGPKPDGLTDSSE
jgi:hypothetical protein